MTKAHLEQRLKDLRGNMKLMEEIYNDNHTSDKLKSQIALETIYRNSDISEVEEQLKLESK